MSYQKIYEKLLAYEPRRLIGHTYRDVRGCCVVGALASHPEALPAMAVTYLYDEDNPLILDIVKKFNCTIDELEELQDYNDEGDHRTPEERYHNLLAFLKRRVAEEGP